MSSNLMKVYFYCSAAERGKFTQLEKRESESDCDVYNEIEKFS